MKKTSKCAFAALAMVAAASAASAQTVVFNSGIRPGSFTGGEFVGTYTGGELAGKSLRGFCLEIGELISLGGPSYGYEVVSGSDGAVHGGSGGPDPDPLSNATAAVFTAWMSGLISNTPANAKSVQEAIWFLEEEHGSATTGATTIIDFVSGLAQYSTLDFNAGADDFDSSLFPNIRVMNPFDVNGDGTRGTERQSQIILIPLPTASGMALAGLALVGGIRRRK